MRCLLFLLILPSFAYAVEISVKGKSGRSLNLISDCGGWGHTGLVMLAKNRAKETASKMCWGGDVELIGEFEIKTICIPDTYSGSPYESVEAIAKFRCVSQIDYSYGSSNDNSCRGRLWCYEG